MSLFSNPSVDFFVQALPMLWKGALVTLTLWVLAMAVGTALAVPMVWQRIYGHRAVRKLIALYVEIFRGTPLLVQMFLLYFGLPQIGILMEPFTAAVVAIGLNSAAYQIEYFRGSIGSVPAGQYMAARAIGMSSTRAFFQIVFPQAVRRVIPQWSNEAMTELKFTSIAYAIGVVELTGEAEKIGYNTFRFVEAFVSAGIIYVLLASIISIIISIISRIIRVPGVTSY